MAGDRRMHNAYFCEGYCDFVKQQFTPPYKLSTLKGIAWRAGWEYARTVWLSDKS
jgi:hypothetical protein